MSDDAFSRGPASGLAAAVEFLGLTAAFAVALLVAPAFGGLVTSVAPVLAALVISALSIAYGRAVSPFLHLPARAPRLLPWVIVGYGSASLVHLCATALLNLTALWALPVDVAVAIAAEWVSRRRRARDVGRTADPAGTSRAITEMVVLLASAALAAFWARETITAMPHAVATGIFPAWQDYFLHAAEISYVRDYPAFERHSQYLTAIAQPLYHRGSYALPALMSALGGMPSLGMATAYWLPTGLFLTMCATYVFGAALGGPVVGVAALTAVFLVPDASAYGFENHFLSFHWLMQMAAGSGYALALVMLALTAIVTAAPRHTTRAMFGAFALATASAAFRVHVALVAMGMIGWLIVLSWRPRVTLKGLALLLVAAVLATGVLMWMESLALAPHFLTGLSHPVVFFQALHTQFGGFASPYTEWTTGRADWWKVLVGFAMMLVASCGASLAVLGIAAGTGVLSRMGTRVGAAGVAVACSLFSVILFVPTPAHGDVTDLGHRPFVLVYLVIGALAGAAAATLLVEWSRRRFSSTRPAALAVALLVVVGLVVPWRVGAKVQQRWMPPYALIFLSPSAIAAGGFVRDHSVAGEQILAASEDAQAALVALTERRAYLSRMPLYQLLGAEAGASALVRAEEHASLSPVTSFEQLKAFGLRTGVSWYIADTPATVLWPAVVTGRSAFSANGVRVYDLR